MNLRDHIRRNNTAGNAPLVRNDKNQESVLVEPRDRGRCAGEEFELRGRSYVAAFGRSSIDDAVSV